MITKYREKYKIQYKIILFIILVTLISAFIIVGFLINKNFKEYYKGKQKLDCTNYFLKNVENFNDFYHLCGDEACKSFFENKIIQNLEFAEKCFDKDVDE